MKPVVISEKQGMPPIAKWIGGIILIPLVVLFMYMAATTGEWIHYTLVTLVTLLVLGGVVMSNHGTDIIAAFQRREAK